MIFLKIKGLVIINPTHLLDTKAGITNKSLIRDTTDF